MNFVQAYNATAIPVTIPRRTKLRSVVEYNQERCYFADPNTDPKLVFTGWKGKAVKIAKFAVTTMAFLAQPSIFPITSTVREISKTVSINIDFGFEYTFQCGITIYSSPPKSETVQKKFIAVVNSYPNIWRDSGSVVDVPKNQWMPINTKTGTNFETFKIYPVGPQNREIINKKFNDLHQQKKCNGRKTSFHSVIPYSLFEKRFIFQTNHPCAKDASSLIFGD